MASIIKGNRRPQTEDGDRILPVEIAQCVLKEELGMGGWSRATLRQKISNSDPFIWVEGVHYLRSGKGLSSINVDAVRRSMLG